MGDCFFCPPYDPRPGVIYWQRHPCCGRCAASNAEYAREVVNALRERQSEPAETLPFDYEG